MSRSSRILEQYKPSSIPKPKTIATVNEDGVHPDLRGTSGHLAQRELEATLQNAPETTVGSSSGYTTSQLKDIAPGSIQTGYTGGPRNIHKIEDQIK